MTPPSLPDAITATHPAAGTHVSAIEQEGIADLLNTTFVALAFQRNLTHQYAELYTTDPGAIKEADLAAKADVVFGSSYSPSDDSVLFEKDGAVLLVRPFTNGRVQVVTAARTIEAARAAYDWVLSLLPEVEEKDEDDTIPVRFWLQGMGGPQSYQRRIAAPKYGELAENYSSEARKELDRMMSDRFEPGAGGQLLLWHGPPGTGKTFALRALSQEWRKWCKVEYVVDPERFFGDASYLMPVLLGSGSGDPDEWRLLIFEDTGELLSADARARAGQGLSRLLNIVDGFIGQGLRTLILITTNEELNKLHPAVSRPGRCAVKVRFGNLSTRESEKWAKRNGLVLPEKRAHSLAELFAIRDEFRHDETDAPEQRKPIGFRMPDAPAPSGESPKTGRETHGGVPSGAPLVAVESDWYD